MPRPDRRDTSRSAIAVELRGVRKAYRQRQRSARLGDLFGNLLRPKVKVVDALRGVDLVVEHGEIVAYAGPNGAGKSTTVKLLSSLLAPDAGTIRCLGMDPVRERTRYVARIGVVFGQRTELWWDHPVEASFDWKRVIWDIPEARYRNMLGALCELLDLHELLPTMARELSLGQRMRADLAMAFLHEPDLLLLDEPTLGLDVLARRRILAFVRQLNRERGTTVIVTSHDMAELEDLAGRIVMLHRGEIAFDGEFSELRRGVMGRRILTIETDGDEAPPIEGATHRESAGRRHEYVFDGASSSLPDLLARASARATLLDVETHRPAIGEVVADLYEQWQRDGAQGHPEEEA